MKSLMQAVLRTPFFRTSSVLLLGIAVACGGSDDDGIMGPPDDGLGKVPELPDPLTPSPARGTILTGNSTGIHECSSRGENRYSHYEAPAEPGAAQLHVIGVLGPDESSGQGNHIKVHVTRAGTTILVLSSDQNAAWEVTAAPGATLERVILNGYDRQTATVPDGVPLNVFSKEDNNQFLGSPRAFQWPSHHATDLVNAAEEITGETLTSFRGCGEGTSFQIDEPGDIATPHSVLETAEPTPLDGCEDVTSESAYCMTLEDLNGFHDRARMRMVGLDNSTMCGGELRADLMSRSLGWEDAYLYECWTGQGIARVSVLDGTTDVAPIPCRAVTSHQGKLYALVDNDHYAPSDIGHVAEFAGFDEAARREAERVFGVDLFAENIAVHDGRLYLARTSQDGLYRYEVQTAELDPGAPITSVPLAYDIEYLAGIDVLDDGRLAILGSTDPAEKRPAYGIYFFDAETGGDQGAISFDEVNEEGGLVIGISQGLKCESADP